jgi:hypothetical protein
MYPWGPEIIGGLELLYQFTAKMGELRSLFFIFANTNELYVIVETWILVF